MNIIVLYLVFINILAFVIFWLDKFKARKWKYRISENTLLFFILLWGFFWALLSMIVFHHKTRKSSFQIKSYFLIVLWLVVVLYFLTKISI